MGDKTQKFFCRLLLSFANHAAAAKLLQLCPTLCNLLYYIACQAPLSMEFFRQEYWSGLPFPSQGDLTNPGI